MTRRTMFTTLFGIGSLLLAADSCAASPLPGGQPLRDRAAGYEMTVLSTACRRRPTTTRGGTYVLGQLGARYTLRVSNHSGRRVEAVVSVDGRDVIDGRPGRLPRQARLPDPGLGLGRHRRLADLAQRGGRLPLLVGPRIVRGAHRQRARGRRHRRGGLPRALRSAAAGLLSVPAPSVRAPRLGAPATTRSAATAFATSRRAAARRRRTPPRRARGPGGVGPQRRARRPRPPPKRRPRRPSARAPGSAPSTARR